MFGRCESRSKLGSESESEFESFRFHRLLIRQFVAHFLVFVMLKRRSLNGSISAQHDQSIIYRLTNNQQLTKQKFIEPQQVNLKLNTNQNQTKPNQTKTKPVHRRSSNNVKSEPKFAFSCALFLPSLHYIYLMMKRSPSLYRLRINQSSCQFER